MRPFKFLFPSRPRLLNRLHHRWIKNCDCLCYDLFLRISAGWIVNAPCDDVDARIYLNVVRVFFTVFHVSFRETNVKRWLLYTKRPLLTGLASSNIPNTFPVFQTHFTVALLSNTFLPRCNRSPHSFFCSRSIHDAVHGILGRFFSFLFRLDVQYFYYTILYSDQSSHWRTETQLGQSGTDWQKAGGFSGFLSSW